MKRSIFEEIENNVSRRFKKEYKDMIKYSACFQKQKEELDTLFRMSNFINALFTEEENLETRNTYNINKYGSISTILYDMVFKGLKSRSFGMSSEEDLVEDIKEKVKNKTYSMALFEAQEEEIESLFKKNLYLLDKIFSKTKKEDRGFFYLKHFDFILQYCETNRVYFNDVALRNDKISKKRPFKISEEDLKDYNEIIKEIKDGYEEAVKQAEKNNG
jgi:hypothetical protein